MIGMIHVFHYSDILKVLLAKLGEEIGKGLFILDISFCISDKKGLHNGLRPYF
jgi:hypothetical protein